MRDNIASEPSGPLAAVQRRVRSWVIAASNLSPVVLSVSTVVLLGLGVVIVARLVTLYDSPASTGSGTAPVLTPALTSTPAPAVPRAPSAEAPAGPTPTAARPVVAAPGPESTAPTPKTHPVPAKPPEQGPGGNLAAAPAASERADRERDKDKVRAETIQSGERAVTAPEAASGLEQGQQRARSEEGTERAVGRSVCARWGIPRDRCDDAIDEYQAD